MKMNNGFGKYDVYAVAGSIYCYKDTNVLKNRLGIKDQQLLKNLEADYSAIKQNKLMSEPINGRFSVNHLCRIHKYLFGDIYYFAGHFRKEDIMKGATRFLHYVDIKARLSTLLSELAGENHLKGLDDIDLVHRSAYYFAELNYIHPFREGNGRTTREFMRQLFSVNGWQISWDKVPAEMLLSAMEESIYDTALLAECLEKMLEK